jgi:hypothetical protein
MPILPSYSLKKVQAFPPLTRQGGTTIGPSHPRYILHSEFRLPPKAWMWWAWDGYNRDQEAKESPVPLLEEWGILLTPEQKKKLLRAKIAVAYYHETGKVPSTEIIDTIYLYVLIQIAAEPDQDQAIAPIVLAFSGTFLGAGRA